MGKYETALLIDTYWRVERGDLSRENGVAFLSQLLRKRAQTFGLEIDDTFRNKDGITLQYSLILAYDMTSFRLITEVSASPTFYDWLFGFGGKVQILAPEHIKNQYKEMVVNACSNIE